MEGNNLGLDGKIPGGKSSRKENFGRQIKYILLGVSFGKIAPKRAKAKAGKRKENPNRC